VAEIELRPHKGKQTEFLKSKANWVFYGGARGGGKSLMLAWKAALTPRRWHYEYKKQEITEKSAMRLKANKKTYRTIVDSVSINYPDYIALLVRRTYPQLERNLKPECDKLYRHYGANWQERNKCYLFPSGAKVYLVHCQDRRALDNYIGGNYNFLGIDEANQFPEGWVDELATSVRTDNPELSPQICLTSNPGNIGHVWLKRKFIDRCPPDNLGKAVFDDRFQVEYQRKKSGKTFRDEDGISWKFIPATVFDNPSLLDNDPGYVKKLKQLNPILRAMWLEGRWDVFAGTFFDNWNPMHHIISGGFQYNKHFKKTTHALYRFYDYGTKAPFVCLFAAVDRNQDMIIFDEIVETGLSASRQAKYVNEYTYKNYKLKPNDFAEDIADPAYWTKHSEKEGRLYSPADFYGDEGIYLSKANNDRKAKAKIVYEGFTVPDEGNPRVRFTENCLYCIETLPNLPAAPLDPEDVDTKSEDHAFDALSYGMLKVLTGIVTEEKRKKGWRYKLLERAKGGTLNWKTA
jgi:hypothetical protein|tara:strand:- start:1874 stop:3427 length:1554 start_codon:yes stop_codon:yes gene_type:complete